MMTPKALVVVIGFLAAGIRAGPCKPSSKTTTTADLTSATGTEQTSSNIALTTSEIVAATTSEGFTITATDSTTTATVTDSFACRNYQKDSAPAGKLCNVKGYGDDPNMKIIGHQYYNLGIQSCGKACRDDPDCIAFAFLEDSFCQFVKGSFKSTDGQQTDFTWYDLDCLCDLDVEATTTDATTTVMATTVAELSTSSEVTIAATTTTSTKAAPSCVGGFPPNAVCNEYEDSTGSVIATFSMGVTLEECVQKCSDESVCGHFASDGNYCQLRSGEYHTLLTPNDYPFFELGCFCVERGS
ncbi:hypothetical protein ACHAPU_011521 [Fusarium lateritium]